MKFPAAATLLVTWLLAASAIPARGDDPRTPARLPGETAEQAVRRAIDESWPDHPEWLDELTDILQETPLGPSDGWHRREGPTSKFDWKGVRDRLDKDGDDRISRGEFAGTDADFARIDRDRDGAITAPDLDFSPHALMPSPGSLFLYVIDEDGNGKVTREEMELFFRRCDSGEQGFLSLSDLQQGFRAQARAEAAPPRRPAAGPTKETLVRALLSQEIGSLESGPKLGEAAPDFTLKTLDGKEEVTLSKVVGPRPVVLVFGNFTCGPFRTQAGNVEKLHRLYKDRATFLMVYVREAHPTDGWVMEANDQVGIALPQPRTYEERSAVAKACGQRLGLGFPMLVDSIDDAVGSKLSGMPSRLYVIDADGKVAYKSRRGPYGFKPAEMEQSLLFLLERQASSAAAEANVRR